MTKATKQCAAETSGYDSQIAIVGGGAAGLVAAITAAKAGSGVTLFEQNDRVGKKILASGNGRCNITNTSLNVNDYFGTDPSFVDFALKEFSFNRFKKFCSSIGLLIQNREDGRCYPLSNTAGSVVTALREYALTCGVTIVCDAFISKVEKVSGCFQVHSGEQLFDSYDAVLIATGSEAAPQLGSNASGYAIAESFGHTVYPAYPSLVALELDSQTHHKMSGTKQDAEVTLYINGKAEQSVRGDILFTRYGISGFAILDISQKASEALMNYQDVKIGLKLLTGYERQSLSEQIAALSKNVPDYTIETLLGGLISSKIVPHVLESCKIAPETPAANVNTKMMKQLSNTLCDWRFQVSDTHGFKHAEVSGGGVA
ncbi:MAG: aminoacetone oxidase family FAD-binding enzyme, partial [Sulfurimonadaceae bacterium]|nr:aminoacetone oxidase family FAD-binding enzyme [Sulfurimonadaceae bacterium]